MARGVVTEYPPPWSRLWPDEESGPWRVTLHYSIRERAVVVVGIDVVAVDRSTCPPLDAETHRKLSITKLARESGSDRIEAALREIETLSRLEHAEHGGPSAYAKQEPAMYDRLGKRGRPPLYSDDHWREVAQTYLLHKQARQPDPIGRVAERYSVSKSTAKNWITATRRRGLLPPATQGE